MSSKPSPIQTPFKSDTTYGYASQDASNPYVQAFQATPTTVDPGAGRRTDLAEQASENRWNSDFTSGLPIHLKMQLQESERRNIAAQGAAEQQSAEYQKNQLELQKNAALMPQLVQTGTSGYNSQLPGSTGPGVASSAIGAGGAITAAAITAGLF